MKNIHIGKEKWTYRVGKRDGVVIRDPKGNKYLACFCCLLNTTWYTVERAMAKKSFHVNPSNVKQYILDRLVLWKGYSPNTKCIYCKPKCD